MDHHNMSNGPTYPIAEEDAVEALTRQQSNKNSNTNNNTPSDGSDSEKGFGHAIMNGIKKAANGITGKKKSNKNKNGENLSPSGGQKHFHSTPLSAVRNSKGSTPHIFAVRKGAGNGPVPQVLFPTQQPSQSMPEPNRNPVVQAPIVRPVENQRPGQFIVPSNNPGSASSAKKPFGKIRRASAATITANAGGSVPLGKTLQQLQVDEELSKAKQVNEAIATRTKSMRTTFPVSSKPLDPNTPLSPLTQILEGLVKKHLADTSGKLASYIPKLAEVDPNKCAVCIVTTTGEVCCAGDYLVEFSIQSISKALVYDLALMHRGREFVMERVDVEPSGEAFNSLKTDSGGRPPNPMVNVGAIEVASMTHGSFDKILEHMGKFAGRQLEIDQEIYESEARTGHKNIALAHLLTNDGILCDTVEKSVEKYFRQCSVLVHAKDLATIAATFANNGVNPINNDHITRPTNVAQVLSVMATCGMYNYAGSWLTEVGLPAKSGVGGGIICVVPGVMGIGCFSPLLDKVGNSHRGVKICQELSSILGLSMFMPFSLMLAAPHTQAEILEVKEFLWPKKGFTSAQIKRRSSLDDSAVTSHFDSEAVFKTVCLVVSGNFSVVGIERIVTRFKTDYLNCHALILDIKDGSRFDTSGLLLTETFCRRMVELGKVLIVCMAEDSPSALKLQDKLGVHAMITDLAFARERFVAMGCVAPDDEVTQHNEKDKDRSMAALLSPSMKKKSSNNKISALDDSLDLGNSNGGGGVMDDGAKPKLTAQQVQAQRKQQMFSKFSTSVPVI